MAVKLIVGFFFLVSITTFAQVGIGTQTPSENSILEVSSQFGDDPTYRGFLPPRVANESQRDAILPNVDDVGLIVYVNDTGCLETWDGAVWQKINCNDQPDFAEDLFFSEYVEGSSNNKAVEIANFTGTSVDLSAYQILIYSNGRTDSESPNHTISLSGILNNGQVYVVAHGNAAYELQQTAQQITSSLSFNGDDALVLVKSSVVIDVLGEVGVREGYGADVTLRRKKHYGPSTVYFPEQFDIHSIDDFSGMGWHNFYE
ncbi:MAG: lamin tail domain-containing protein [Bacteroidetes bacterium]|jgi:hypothetical protein|nr:lamin tail domain-containing protein [Bacteroidota bacterium]